MLTSSKVYKGQDIIYVGNGNKLSISHTRHIQLHTPHGNLESKNVLVVPKLKKNLLSVSQFFTTNNSCVFEFSSNGFVIKDQNQKILAKGHK